MNIFLDSVGCRLNQSEIENMARHFRAAGHEIVPTAGEADLAVINTCTVTARAAADSRGKIRKATRTGVEEIIATGCWVTLHPSDALELSNKLCVVENAQKEKLVPDILNLPVEAFDLKTIPREPIPGLRQRTRSFVKVQDGCDNSCTFCVTTIARGQERSRPINEIISDISSSLQGGTKEIVLTGVHLGSWGQEWNYHLRDLIEGIFTHTDTKRLRLSSLEPWDLTQDFFQLWEDVRLCQHLHLPLQSGCDDTLRRMARKTTTASFRELVNAARQIIPEVAITTDVIAGFPGETEQEFSNSISFIKEMNFAGGHAFTFSARPGTAATRLGNQIKPEVRKERNAILREVFKQGLNSYSRRFIGQNLNVLWETSMQMNAKSWQMEGLSPNYLRVKATASQPLWNTISPVQLVSLEANGLHGRIMN